MWLVSTTSLPRREVVLHYGQIDLSRCGIATCVIPVPFGPEPDWDQLAGESAALDAHCAGLMAW
jgi:hypothetical protein